MKVAEGRGCREVGFSGGGGEKEVERLEKKETRGCAGKKERGREAQENAPLPFPFLTLPPPSLSCLKEKPPPAWSTARPCTRWRRRLLSSRESRSSSSSSSPSPPIATLIASLGTQPLQPAPPPQFEGEAAERPLRTLESLSEAESPRRLLRASEEGIVSIFDERGLRGAAGR